MLIKLRNFMALMFLSCLLIGCSYTYPSHKNADDGSSQQVLTPDPVFPTAETNVPSTKEVVDTSYKMVDIDCQTFLQGKWGTGPSEFSYAPYHPIFDEEGNMFIADPNNGKVLKYAVGTKKPDVIPIPPEYVLDGNSNYKYWSNVNVSQGKIYLLFSSFNSPRIVRNLAILSLDGKELEVISLEPYHPYDVSIYSTPAIADRMGGVYVLLEPLGVVHYDETHQSTLTQLSSLETFTVGWDGEIYTHYLEDSQITFFQWGNNLRPLSTRSGNFSIDLGPYSRENHYYVQVEGIDSQNRIYLSLSDKIEIKKIIRFSPGETTALIGDVPREWVPNVYGLSVAPDGNLYSLVYDHENETQQPKIIQCSLVEE